MSNLVMLVSGFKGRVLYNLLSNRRNWSSHRGKLLFLIGTSLLPYEGFIFNYIILISVAYCLKNYDKFTIENVTPYK